MNSFILNVLTSEETVFNGNVIYVNLPTATGSIGILANHTPLMALTTTGKLKIKTSNGQMVALNLDTSGFLEIYRNNVKILLNDKI